MMTSSYDSRGRRVGATIVKIDPNYITQIKTVSGKDHYNAVQLAMGTKKSVKNPQKGHFKKVGAPENLRWVKEARMAQVEDLKPGQQIQMGQVFSKGDVVKVTGISKGRGFQGGVRRHGFSGGPKTHGQSDRHRAPGSIGSGTTPGRVYKGKRMAGHMGDETVSLTNLEIVEIDKKNNLVVLKGGVPGSAGGLIILTKQGTVKGYIPPPEPEPEEEVKENAEE